MKAGAIKLSCEPMCQTLLVSFPPTPYRLRSSISYHINKIDPKSSGIVTTVPKPSASSLVPAICLVQGWDT